MTTLRNLMNLTRQPMSINISPDELGLTGRECPNESCEGYFKIEFGTGLKGENLPCHCPYCGHKDQHDQFWTKAQIEYAKSVAMRKISDAIFKDLKTLEFNHKPKSSFGIGISMKVKRDSPVPIHYYREDKLETEVICSSCTLRYSVYGVFAFCPDCGEHNSLQILEKNYQIIEKMLDLAAETSHAEIAERLIENALEDTVSAFDGFGREVCRIYSHKATNPNKILKISFQNLELVKKRVIEEFSLDISSCISNDEWGIINRLFQKRHLISHKMGVVDKEYIQKTGDINEIAGRKVKISTDDIKAILAITLKVGKYIISNISEK